MTEKGDTQSIYHVTYGPVLIVGGMHKGRALYYDDDATPKTAICYLGHPIDFVENDAIRKTFLRHPTIDDLLNRNTDIHRQLSHFAIDGNWNTDPAYIHQLWSEKSMIYEELRERQMISSLRKIDHKADVFLCHSSADKWQVRKVHDDLVTVGASPWLDENRIKVGDSIVARINDALHISPTMIIFLSRTSVESLWTRKEWQSFIARQLAGKNLALLPALLENCEIPAILQDVKYADFTKSYNMGFEQLYKAIL